MAACVLGAGVGAPAQTMLLDDDFEDYTAGASLLGQTAPNGSTWYDRIGTTYYNDSSLILVSAAYGTGGTGQGAGRADTDIGHGAFLYLPLGERITDEIVTLECDIYSASNYDYGWNIVSLYDSVNNRWLDVGFGTANFPDQVKRVYYEWNDDTLGTVDLESKRQATGGFHTIHIIQTFDLANKSVTLEWREAIIGEASGSFDAVYTLDFAPDSVRLVLKSDGTPIEKGYDNLSVTVDRPPPPKGALFVLQ